MPPRSPEQYAPPPPSPEALEATKALQLLVAEQTGPLALVGTEVHVPEVVEHQQRVIADAPNIGGAAVDGVFGKVKNFLKNKSYGDEGGVIYFGSDTESLDVSNLKPNVIEKMMNHTAFEYELVNGSSMTSSVDWAKYGLSNDENTGGLAGQSNDQEQPWYVDAWKAQRKGYGTPWKNESIFTELGSNQELQPLGDMPVREVPIPPEIADTEWWVPAPETATDQYETAKFVEIDQSDVVEFDTEVEASQVAELMERQRVVKIAPELNDVAADDTRTNTITFINRSTSTWGKPPRPGETVRVETEQQAAVEFTGFLHTYIDTITQTEAASPAALNLVDRAKDMLENLTFIGEKERTEAARGIADYWKTWLREDPARQICALAQISEGDSVKSDRYLMDSILSNFTDQDMEELGDRLVTTIDDVTALTQDAKIVLVDDWTISGSQMQQAYNRIKKDPKFSTYLNSLEMQLVTSTKGRIEDGLQITDFNESAVNVPIRSYFMSHETPMRPNHANKGHMAYETGGHSSVDFNYEVDYIAKMVAVLNSMPDTTEEIMMPSLTNIDRVYKKGSFSVADLEHVQRLQERGSRRRMLAQSGAVTGGEL